MPIPRSDAYAFPVELPAALCGAAEASTEAAAHRKEQHPEPTQLLSRSLATGRAACHCATPEERIYFGGAPPACPSEHRRVLQLHRKPRAAFPARRVRHKETNCDTQNPATLAPNSSRPLRIRAQNVLQASWKAGSKKTRQTTTNTKAQRADIEPLD